MDNIIEPSDKRIIRSFWNRDQDAILLVTQKYARYLHRIAYNILGSDEDCEECVNDTYLKVWNSIPPERPENFKAYLAKIIRNTALDKCREESREKRIAAEKMMSLSELEECIPDVFATDEEFKNKFLKSIIDEFVRSLPKREKYVFVCRFYCNDTVEAIASSLKLSPSMIYHEIAEIKRKLKEKITSEEP